MINQRIPNPNQRIADMKSGYADDIWWRYFKDPMFNSIGLVNALEVSSGGTGLSSGTDGGILGFVSTTQMASSGLLTQNAIVLGGGVGATPSTPVGLGSAHTLLHGNSAGAPSWSSVDLTADVSNVLPVVHGGTSLSSGNPGSVLAFTTSGVIVSSSTLTTNAVLVGGGSGGSPSSLVSTGVSTQVLHGNSGGQPTWSQVVLTADVTGILPVSNGGIGVTTVSANTAFVGPISGTDAPPSFKVVHCVQHKSTDQSITSLTTLTSDSDLQCAINANEDWVGRVYVDCGAALGTTGLKVTVSAPVGSSGSFFVGMILDSVNATDVTMRRSSTLGTPVEFTAANLATASDGMMDLAFHCVNSSTAGSIIIQWAQSTSSATPLTFRAGSQMNMNRVA